MRNFSNYDIWKSGMDIADKVYSLTDVFPNMKHMALQTNCAELLFPYHRILLKAVPVHQRLSLRIIWSIRLVHASKLRHNWK